MRNDKENIIVKLTFEFSLDIMDFSEELESKRKFVFANQILKAGTSIGANVSEAQNAQSKADFIHKNSISLKEARESNFWLRLVLATTNFDESIKAGIQELEEESMALSRIIGKIIVTSKK